MGNAGYFAKLELRKSTSFHRRLLVPFKSEAQRRFLHARHSKLAQEWEEKYPPGNNLPQRVKRQKRKPSKRVDPLFRLNKR